MPSRFRGPKTRHDFNIWMVFTDLMSNAFILLSLFLILIIISNQSYIMSLTQELDILRTQYLTNPPQGEPPVFIIPTTGQYKFDVGSAALPPSLADYVVQDLIPEIKRNYENQKYQIDVVEVIGHTDGQPIAGQASNLDTFLEAVLAGQAQQQQLTAGSNTDLGLMRAMSVVKAIRDQKTAHPWLGGLQFRAYSAGQMVLPQGAGLSGLDRSPSRIDEPDRRRIEIRFTRLGEERIVSPN